MSLIELPSGVFIWMQMSLVFKLLKTKRTRSVVFPPSVKVQLCVCLCEFLCGKVWGFFSSFLGFFFFFYLHDFVNRALAGFLTGF